MEDAISVNKSVQAVEQNRHHHQEERIRLLPARLAEGINESPVQVMRCPENQKYNLDHMHPSGEKKEQDHQGR